MTEDERTAAIDTLIKDLEKSKINGMPPSATYARSGIAFSLHTNEIAYAEGNMSQSRTA
jgi:hypothetical protein